MPPLGGGAGNATANIAREMAALGHDVTVLTSRFPGLQNNELVNGYRVRRIWTIRRRVDRCTPFEMIVFMASAMLAISTFIRRKRPSVIIAFFGIPSGPVAWVAKALYGIPYIISLRGGDVPGYQPYDLNTYHKLLRPLIVWFWLRAAAVVANSQGLRELAQQSASELPISVIPNGVDGERFRPDRRGDARARLRLLFVGRLQHQKGIDVLLRAMTQVASPDMELLVVGDGPERNMLKAMAREFAIQDNVMFHGWADRSELPILYQSADIFVLPSRDEGMPNVLLEAMASGLPAIATRISGSEELVVDGETGFLVPPDDANTLANAISLLSADSSLRENLGRNARVRVEREFNWRAVAEAYLDLVERWPSHPQAPNRNIDAV
nr:glycosyltransferase [Microvirga puerhi]